MSLQSWPGTECSARVGEMMMKTTLSAVLLGLGLAFSVPSFAAVIINTADQKTLETLPGVGPAKAQAIIAHRPYKSKEDLQKVDGLGDTTYKILEPDITARGGSKAAKYGPILLAVERMKQPPAV